MRNICTLGLVGFLAFLGGCVSYHTANDEQIDLYLSTLDDKHFVWCELDLEQCQHDFEQWKRTTRGTKIIEEFEQEDARQPDNTHHLSNVFRTRFVDESRLPKEMEGEHGKGQDFSQDSERFGRSFSSIAENGTTIEEGISPPPRIHGPQFAP
ncbi:hypothetical protein [uncultured Nitrospira sp.]|uniref:hypothetical protein n=1 Tax=uncultured Nitrospira sp. TaxID=157176 RepID=UPI003140A056